jgi:hypothetical protein
MLIIEIIGKFWKLLDGYAGFFIFRILAIIGKYI